MIFEEDFLTFLKASSVNALCNGQIYGLQRPKGERPLPEILIQRASTVRQKLFCGTSNLVSAQIQVDSFGLQLDQTLGLARALRLLLVDYTGTMGDTYVEDVSLDNEFPTVDADPGIFRITQLYDFWYAED